MQRRPQITALGPPGLRAVLWWLLISSVCVVTAFYFGARWGQSKVCSTESASLGRRPLISIQVPGKANGAVEASQTADAAGQTATYSIVGSSSSSVPQGGAVADSKAAATAGADSAAAAIPPRVADAEKQAAIKAAFLHAWKGYRAHAWGKDELQPVSKQGRSSENAPFADMAATLVDSLSSLWMLGFKEEFQVAAAWVERDLQFKVGSRMSLFETNIRILGGLLSAFDLSGQAPFLARATQLGDLMLTHFPADTRTGMPLNWVQLAKTKPGEAFGARGSVAEWGSFGLEFYRLSKLTRDPKYFAAAEKIYKFVFNEFPTQGVLPAFILLASGEWSSGTLTIGAMGDSYYEYLLKLWLLKQPQDDAYWQAWERAMDDVMRLLLGTTASGDLYVSDRSAGVLEPHMEHLSCYLPGNLALGAAYGLLSTNTAREYLKVAEGLAHTCWVMSNITATGLCPDIMKFDGATWLAEEPTNRLRPEAVEAWFYLWRITGKQIYRDWSWSVFEAFERHSRAEAGHSAIQNVNIVPAVQDDYMESFWLAETLKYMFLTFDGDSYPLDEYVFNTEAHALLVEP